jgi:hypothetical protein
MVTSVKHLKTNRIIVVGSGFSLFELPVVTKTLESIYFLRRITGKIVCNTRRRVTAMPLASKNSTGQARSDPNETHRVPEDR